jgi:thiol-activated cytolysin
MKKFISISKMAILGGVAMMVPLASCQDDAADERAARAKEINEYVATLSYTPDDMLNVQSTGAESVVHTLVNDDVAVSSSRNGGYNITCTKDEYNLKSNFEEVAILRPTNGVIFPGALVIGDADMLDGAPTPLQVDRAPVKLRIDLPGMGENGNLVVENPSNGTVQAKIDEALDWWNENAYQEGYVNPSFISYKTSTSYSSQQLSIDVGLNVSWASGDVAAQFNYQSTTEKSVAMMAFKQGFYSVTMEAPQQPADVFHPNLKLEDIESKINSGTPPAFVQSVVYGRIIMFRMESSSKVTSTDMKLALEYTTGVTSLSGDTKTRIENILKQTSTTVVTIGGNAAVASEAVAAQTFGDLQKTIKGENAVYSKSNPGVPISYTIWYLRDNKLAKMGYTTDYSVPNCSQSLVPGARLSVQNDAGYLIRFYVHFKDSNNVAQKLSSGDYSAGFKREVTLPDGAHDITLDVDFRSVFDWFDFWEKKYSIPTRKCYKTWGTLFDKQHGEIGCN